MASNTVLCVDTGDGLTETTTRLAEEPRLDPVERTTVADATDYLESESVACVVTEYDLEDGTGMDVVRSVREAAPQTPCVLYTSTRPNEIETDAVEEVIVEYLNKDLPDAGDRLTRPAALRTGRTQRRVSETALRPGHQGATGTPPRSRPR